jgi:hypothetical protein
LILAKPLKLIKKFAANDMEACTSGLSIGENASSAKTSFGPSPVVKKMPSVPTEKDELGYASTRVVNMLILRCLRGALAL